MTSQQPRALSREPTAEQIDAIVAQAVKSEAHGRWSSTAKIAATLAYQSGREQGLREQCRISISTNTMEQEFATYERRGISKGREALLVELRSGGVGDWILVPKEPTARIKFLAEMPKPRGYTDLSTAMLAAAPTLKEPKS